MPEDEYERYLLQRLADLRAGYERDAKPYIDQLVRLRSQRPPPPITFELTLEQAQALGLKEKSDG